MPPDDPITPTEPPKMRTKGSISVHPLADGPVAGLPLDPVAIRVLEESFAAIKPSATRLTQEFYRRLFERHPHLRRMFPCDLWEQEKKLADTLVAVIEGLRDPAALRLKVRDLGRLHAEKGVVPEHYAIVTGLLLECMADAACSAWTPSVQSEWRRALDQISSLMIGASVQKT